MSLDGQQINRLQQVLLAAFPPLADLRQMVFVGLHENLDAITTTTNPAEATLELLVWAQSHQKLAQLIATARELRPENVDLQEFASLPRRPEDAEQEAARLERERRGREVEAVFDRWMLEAQAPGVQ